MIADELFVVLERSLFAILIDRLSSAFRSLRVAFLYLDFGPCLRKLIKFVSGADLVFVSGTSATRGYLAFGIMT